MNRKIMVAGFCCVDITPVFDAGQLHSDRISELFVPGKIIPLEGAHVGCGGSVSNTGLALKILGAEPVLVGALGNDEFGDIAFRYYERYRAEKNLIRRDSLHTGFTLCIVPPHSDRFFLVNPGSNDCFDSSFLDPELVRGCRIFHFGYPTIMKRMYADGCAELIRMYRSVHDMGVLTSMDTAMSDPASAAMRVDWNAVLQQLFPYLDLFTPSIEELCLMTDPARYASWTARAKDQDVTQTLSVEKDILPLADRMIGLGAGIVMLKCGLPGILLKTAGRERIARIPGLGPEWADLTIFEKSFRADRVLSGTGAGDTSIAAFLKCLADGRTPADCLRLAAATGACNVTEYDSLSGLRPLAECEARIRSGWKKYDE